MKDGTVKNEVRSRYGCHYKVRHPDRCDGQSGYGMTKVDNIMDQIIRHQLSKIKTSSSGDLISKQHAKSVELARAKYKLASTQLSEKKRELRDYRAETIRVIRGESKLNVDLLNDLIQTVGEQIEVLETAVASAKQEYEFISSNVSKEQQELQKLQTWADLYDNCSFSAKKMLVAQFIKAVYVYRDYRIEVEFNVSFDAFQEMSAQCVNRGNEHTDVYEEIKENAALPKDRTASYEHNDIR